MSVTGSAPASTSTGTAGASIGFRPGLDGLRAVAVLAVIAYHLDAPWMRGGFLGVDLFMVLSGYLITGLLLAEAERAGGAGRISLRSFWARRIRRILPAVVVLLIAVALYAWWFATPVERASLRWDAVASLTSWANWRFIVDGSGYWAQFGPPSPLTHMWSLAVEEQFYLVWPLVVAGVAAVSVGARRRRLLLAVAVAGTLASFVAMIALYDPAFPSRAYLGTDTRVQTLLIGAIGALLLRPGPDRAPLGRATVRVAGPLAAVGVVAALVAVDDRAAWMYHGGFTAFALGALVLVVAAGEHRGPLAGVLRVGLLVWIGQRSYGWYLWHWPLIVWLTPERLGPFGEGSARVAVVLAGTVACAEVSYRMVERPLRTAGGPRPGPVLPVAAAASLVVTATALVTTTRVTVPERPILGVADLALVEPAPPRPAPLVEPSAPIGPEVPTGADGTGSAVPFPGPGDIVFVEPPVDPDDDLVAAAAGPMPSEREIRRILLQGDSIAIFSAMPLGEALAAAGVDFDDRTFPGQTISNPAVLDAVEHSGADLSVWYVSMWDTGDPDEVRAHHERFVAASIAAGADVVFVDRPPVDPELETDERQHPRRLAAELARADPARVHLLDASPVWGGRMVIDADGDGIPERMLDGVHVCPQGSARWTAWFLDELARRYPSLEPPDPSTWLDGSWLDDPHWAANVGQCDLVT